MAFTEFEAPINCGFTANGTGWVRLWLTNDDLGGTGADLFAVSGRFYPLDVAKYAFDDEIFEHPDSLTFEESPNLGGYTRCQGLDESPYTDLPSNVGFYATSDVDLEVTPRGADARTVAITAGDFYAQDVTAVGSVDYLFLVMP